MTRTKQAQPMQGEVFGLFKITGESPKRSTRGSLGWQCECVAAGHPIQIEHAVLAYGATPTQCAECVQQAATERANEHIEEKKLAKELAKELALTALEQLRAAPVVAQQQEGAI
jgi:hypothetical protein